MNTIIDTIRHHLTEVADQKLAESGQRYFKTPVKMYGTKTADIEKYAKQTFNQIKAFSKADIFTWCEVLWQSGYMEESFIACQWSYQLREQYQPEDIDLFEHWIKTYVNNWASCDTLCNHTVGTLIEKYPQCIDRLLSWAKTDHLWLQRAAAVSLIIPARKGLFQSEIMSIADIELNDPEDLVQKGYGWMLKAASQAHTQLIFDYVMSHKQTMPRTALRYAIEKMDANLRQQAMKK